MEGKNLFIGIFTAKDYRIGQDNLKTVFSTFAYGKKELFSEGSSDWIIQESGYALAKDMKLLFLIENGVDVNAALQGDLEYIKFSRENPAACFKDINEIIGSLIGESPDTTLMQTSAPPPETKTDEIEEGQRNDTEQTQEQLFRKKFVDAYGKLYGLICEKRNIIEAEKKLDEIIQEFKDSKYSSSFWKAKFYQLKLDAGFPEALNDMEILCKEYPDDIHPLNSLGSSYKTYGQYTKAADQYLKISRMQRSLKDKVKYICMAADCYASDKNYDEAYKVLLKEFKNKELDTNTFAILYKGLSEIAKIQGNKVLFAAFAEKALEIFPTDFVLRFALAYLYEEVGNTPSSLAHYKFLCEHNPDGSNFNNIGVAYSRLNMKGKAIESYSRASEEYKESLAMANIAYGYINEGFLKEASDILKVARAQENYHKNVDSATSRIREVKEEEEESLTKTSKTVEPEQKFLIKFAEAYTLPSEVDVTGKWTYRHGEIFLNMRDNKVFGESESVYQSLANTLAQLKIGGLGAGQMDSKQNTSIDGIINNSSIEYQLKVKTTSAGVSLLTSGVTETVYTGLMYVSKDAQRISVMEWKEGKHETEFYEMIKIPHNS
jgi:tetratricopeptide (TPR) repeat protein